MQYQELKKKLRSLGLTNTAFEKLMGKNTNWVSNMNKKGVTPAIAAIVDLMVELNKHVSIEQVKEIVKKRF